MLMTFDLRNPQNSDHSTNVLLTYARAKTHYRFRVVHKLPEAVSYCNSISLMAEHEAGVASTKRRLSSAKKR